MPSPGIASDVYVGAAVGAGAGMGRCYNPEGQRARGPEGQRARGPEGQAGGVMSRVLPQAVGLSAVPCSSRVPVKPEPRSSHPDALVSLNYCTGQPAGGGFSLWAVPPALLARCARRSMPRPPRRKRMSFCKASCVLREEKLKSLCNMTSHDSRCPKQAPRSAASRICKEEPFIQARAHAQIQRLHRMVIRRRCRWPGARLVAS